ncbi:MAG: hypothetical protein EP321_05375 [Sphingomonadales bacterium]|nr:MAG: hypothetical protein EP345_17840 [Sphingomonadales bacterium]TNF04962.1 MAG: hypothetical protein EP321_05375 [Sphingomonadales bacterium]
MTTSRAEYLAKGVLGLESQPLSNIHSWRLCYDYFAQPDDAFDHDEGALRLRFFLASWGMFRPSSKLRDFSYFALSDVVALLRLPSHTHLRGLALCDAIRKAKEVLALADEITNALADKSLVDQTGKISKITVTDTLRSKIALGAMGCLPAYDRFFIAGARKRGWNCHFDPHGMAELFRSALSDREFRGFCAKLREDERCRSLPDMRLLDAYLNHLGRFENGSRGTI